MPRPRTLEARSEAAIATCAPDAPDRFVDLQVEVRHGEDCPRPGTLVGIVGGRWDKHESCFTGEPAATSVVIEILPGQIELMEAWFTWFRAYTSGSWVEWLAKYGPRPYSFWAVGGRRRGKTWIGVATVIVFAVALAGSMPWIVSEIEDDFICSGDGAEPNEIPRYWKSLLPRDWYDWDERELTISLINGSRVSLKSAHNPENTKKGESSYVFYNEAQKSAQGAYSNSRGAITDSGSIVFVGCNPPKVAVGYWVQDMVIKLRRGEVDGYLKEFTEKNPRVDESSLDSMSKEMSRREYLIEREGRFMGRTDIVLHEFEAGGDRGNVRDVPEAGDVTHDFLAKKLGLPLNRRVAWYAAVGMDFQMHPHMAAVVERYFFDPLDPTDALSWTVDEVVIEQGDEDDLVDGLEAIGLRGDECAVIADASGSWQQGDRKRGQKDGRGSWDMLRNRGWRNIFAPSPFSRANPLILERVAVANARIRSHDDRQHAFVSPHCVLTVEALAHWPNSKEGFPSRRSQWSHIGDAWTYPKFRLWPRKLKPRNPRRPIQTVNIHRRNDEAFAEDHGDRDEERGPRVPPRPGGR
jgi:hypothetical protein